MRNALRGRSSTRALVVLAAALGLASSAGAEPRTLADRSALRRQLVDLKRRARALEEKIRRVEAELARDVSARSRVSRSLAPVAAADCRLPFYLDSAGIKHLRPDCFERTSEPSCDPPYNLDEQGVRRFRPACAPSAALESDRANR